MSKGFTYMYMRLSIINRRWQVIICHIFTRKIVFTLGYILFRERERGEREVDFENFPSASNLGQTTSGQRFSNFFTYPI